MGKSTVEQEITVTKETVDADIPNYGRHVLQYSNGLKVYEWIWGGEVRIYDNDKFKNYYSRSVTYLNIEWLKRWKLKL